MQWWCAGFRHTTFFYHYVKGVVVCLHLPVVIFVLFVLFGADYGHFGRLMAEIDRNLRIFVAV